MKARIQPTNKGEPFQQIPIEFGGLKDVQATSIPLQQSIETLNMIIRA